MTTPPAGPGPDYDVKQELALDPGENRIEVIAYEGRNLLASLPARTTIAYDGPADTVKPKLYILAIGINDYVDYGGREPAAAESGIPAAHRVRAGCQGFQRRDGKGRRWAICRVRVTKVLDADATAAKLDETFRKLAARLARATPSCFTPRRMATPLAAITT